MKKGYAWLIFSLGLTVSLSAQTLAEWQLDDLNYAQATNVATNLTAADFQRGNGISAITYAPTGATASNWSAFTSRESADYFEICVTADNGRTVEITGISYQERRTADGIRTFDLRYSTDGFATNTLLDNVLVPDNTLQRFHSSSMSMKIKPGEQICYRWYGYQSEADAGEWEIDNITLSGTVLAPCAAPTSIGTITPNTITPTTMRLQLGAGGDGVARIIFMRAGAPVEAIPCQGDSYVADNHFGDGDQVGPDTYVVGLTASDNANILITGLSPGTTYYVAVYEFSSLCYYNTPATASAATDCHVASPAYAEMTAPLDGRVSMLWTNPGCADQVLVLASPSPISGTPTGDGSQYVPNVMYGAGTYSADFSAGAYPVYVGTGEHLTVTGLSNGTLYYFAIFTYYNGSWSVALTFTETPVNGCDELGGDHVFVNEFHYWDAGVDQDEGVEIIGPAGTDLSLYEVYIYNRSNEQLAPDNGYLQHSVSLSGAIDNEAGGRGAVWFAIPDMPDNAGAIALYNIVSQEFVQFFAYRNDVDAVDGPAAGMFAEAVEYGPGAGFGNAFESAVAEGETLQLFGEGECPSDFGWRRADQTRYELNGEQTILPVELLSFTAKAVGDQVQLNWQTANEQNSDYFIIEHSTDARTFTLLGEVAAAGHSSTLLDYELMDKQPAAGLNYYRLRQVDFDGTIHEHGLAVVRFAGDAGGPVLQVFPNPVADQATVYWTAEATDLWLFDINGRPVRQQPLNGEPGSLSLDMGGLPGGFYLLRLETSQGVETMRLVKR